METITEDYVSFEIAKLLKEKGFNEECFALYNPNCKLIQSGIRLNNVQVCRVKGSYSAPTHQMAMKWLREVHNINIDIVPIWNQKRFEYQVFVITPENAKHCYIDDKLYFSYEEATEAAIKYCLKHLILNNYGED